MRMEGLEPSRFLQQRILSPSCLPIPPHSLTETINHCKLKSNIIVINYFDLQGGTQIRTEESKICNLLPYHLAIPPLYSY